MLCKNFYWIYKTQPPPKKKNMQPDRTFNCILTAWDVHLFHIPHPSLHVLSQPKATNNVI